RAFHVTGVQTCALPIWITHDPADAFALADRIAVMEDGRIVQTGTPEDIVLSPVTPFVAAVTGAELLGGWRVVACEEGRVTVELRAEERRVGEERRGRRQ